MMAQLDKISHLEDLLDLPPGTKIASKKVKNLTAPGENYGSLMLSLDLILENSSGREEPLNIVAKLLPPNPQMQELFNCKVTFRNEIAFYKTIVPTLRKFQRKHGVEKVINFFPQYFGGRLNLTRGDEIDANAVLLLENLKVASFTNLDRTKGFDFETSKLVLRDLAQLHAVPLALKLQQPEVFDEKVKPFLQSLSCSEEVLQDFQKKYDKIINSVDGLKPFLERLQRVNIRVYPPPPPREPWGTISHNDCWVNNTMVQLHNGNAVANKLVDFQICDYSSPSKDVLFFLFTSVEDHIIEARYDDLIKFYYKSFCEVLKDLKCDLTQFSFDAFLNELDIEAKQTQFVHTALMLFPIFAPRGSVKDISELTPNDIGNGEPTELHKQKLVFVVKEFAKRNWF